MINYYFAKDSKVQDLYFVKSYKNDKLIGDKIIIKLDNVLEYVKQLEKTEEFEYYNGTKDEKVEYLGNKTIQLSDMEFFKIGKLISEMLLK